MLYQKYGFHSSNSVLFDFASSSLQSSPLLSSSIPTPQQDRENERFQHQIIIIFKIHNNQIFKSYVISHICVLPFKIVSSNLLLFSVYITIQFPVTRFPPLSPPSVVSFFAFLSFFQMFFIIHHSLDSYRSNTIQYISFIV